LSPSVIFIRAFVATFVESLNVFDRGVDKGGDKGSNPVFGTDCKIREPRLLLLNLQPATDPSR
jgi:hypothetical protein